jgi:hypothetical protein
MYGTREAGVKHCILLHWSDEDQAHIDFLPTWEEAVFQPVTVGATYDVSGSDKDECECVLVPDRNLPGGGQITAGATGLRRKNLARNVAHYG